MTTDELTAVLVQIVNKQPPRELAKLIRESAGLTEEQAGRVADAVETYCTLREEVKAIEAEGGQVEIPPEWPR